MDWWTYLIAMLALVGLLMLSYAMDWLGAQTFGKYHWLVAGPGIIAHELAHLAACLVTFTHVEDVKLLGKEGGHVVHTKRGIFLNAVIGTAPLFLGILLLALTGYFLLPGGLRGVSVTGGPWELVKDLAVGLFRYIFRDGGWKDWRFYLFLYVAYNLMSTLAPSAQDLGNSAAGIAVVVLLAVAAVVARNLLDWGWWDQNWVVDFVAEGILQMTAIGVMAWVLALLLILPIYLVKRAVLRS